MSLTSTNLSLCHIESYSIKRLKTELILNVLVFNLLWFLLNIFQFIDFISETTFPKLRVCSHSQHSKWKLAAFYPNITEKTLEKFYGYANTAKERYEWDNIVMKKEVEKYEEDWGNTLGVNISGKGPSENF